VFGSSAWKRNTQVETKTIIPSLKKPRNNNWLINSLRINFYVLVKNQYITIIELLAAHA